jgi:glycosyltransferase involved in cell wall biosynthesis
LIKERIYSSQRIREFQNGIPFEEREESVSARNQLLKEFSLPLDALIILTPIRLAPEKNIDLLLRIAPKVVQDCPRAVFLIAGDGPLQAQCLRQIKLYGLEENVKLIGFRPDIQGLLKGTDIFLLPSFLELHSIAILEAMSMKVPVVVSQGVGCNDEFIQDWQKKRM